MTFGSYEWYAMVEQTIDDLYAQELNRAPDVSGRANLMHLAREGGWTDQEMRAFLRNSDEWHALHDPKPEPELPTFTDAQLRTFSGNFCGIQIPGLPYKNPLFTPAYPIYDDVWRQVIREASRKRGTHFPISLFAGDIYHGIYPAWDGANINDCLRELLEDGLIPVGFYHRDDGMPAQGVDPSLVPIVVPMWEMNGPLNNDTDRINAITKATRDAFPQSLLYVHFTAGHG